MNSVHEVKNFDNITSFRFPVVSFKHIRHVNSLVVNLLILKLGLDFKKFQGFIPAYTGLYFSFVRYAEITNFF